MRSLAVPMPSRSDADKKLGAEWLLRGQEDQFHISVIPERRVGQGAILHGWRMGARLGPEGKGNWANMAQSISPTAPASRKANYRELLLISQSPFQVGLPPTINTDAPLGFPFYPYQSPEILFTQRMGERDIWIRVEEDCSKGSSAGSDDVTQRAKVGYCPCCARMTHVIIPPSSVVGKFDKRASRREIAAGFRPLGGTPLCGSIAP